MTNLLHKYSKRKEGWRVKFLFTKDKKVIQDTVMVINGMGNEYMVQVDEGTPEKLIPHHLENKVVKLVKELEANDINFVTRESLMYAIMVEALRAQTQYFVGYLKKEEKQKLNDFNRKADNMAKVLSMPYKRLVGEDMLETIKGDIAEAVYGMYDMLRQSSDAGMAEDFIQHVKSFSIDNEEPVEEQVESDEQGN